MAILEYFRAFDTLQYCVQGKCFDDRGVKVVSVGDFLTILLSVDCEKVEGIRLSSPAPLLGMANCISEKNPFLLSLVEAAIRGNSIDQRIEKMVHRFVLGMVIPFGMTKEMRNEASKFFRVS